MAEFIDTNVFLYAVSRHPAESGKRKRARELIEGTPFVTSCQVVQEFYFQATHPKRQPPLAADEVETVLKAMRAEQVAPVTVTIFDGAVRIRERYGISYWDAAIIAAAREEGCGVVYSEDLQHGQNYDGIRVENPFYEEGEDND